MIGGRLTDTQVAEEIAVAVAEALHRSLWADGPTRAQHARHAVLETLARCRVQLAPLAPAAGGARPLPVTV